MSNLHHKTPTNREVLVALLEGKEIQELDKRCVGEEAPKWDKLESYPLFSVDDLDKPFKRFIYTDDPCIYRIKPEIKTVRVFNGVELPDCITEPLKIGDTYYVANPVRVYANTWSGSEVEKRLVDKGLVYTNLKDAEAHYKALTTYETIEKEVS